jgi:hypothetical protein
MSDGSPKRNFPEEINLMGGQLVDKVKELIQEGNVRRVTIKDHSGKIRLEIPLTLGVVSAAGLTLFAPILAAVGALAALVTQAKLEVERYEDDNKEPDQGPTTIDIDGD